MREIVLDTETTGLDPKTGDRIVEIGCVELLNMLPTGNNYHVYINPERDMPQEAFRVHGLSSKFLSDKPVFSEIYKGFLDFIGNESNIIIHNAEFDMRFINAEFERLGIASINKERIIDTLLIARKKHPGASNSLDALCKRYGIDNSKRTQHGALLDSEILAEVYLELRGGRQTIFELKTEKQKPQIVNVFQSNFDRNRKLALRLDENDFVKHQNLVESMKGKSIWSKYKLGE